MKIHQLPIGSRFEYEGQEYVKTGPLFGTGSAGPRLIPKYASLRPLGDAAVAAQAARSASLSRLAVLKALDALYAECQTLVPDDRHEALNAARDRFVKALDD